MNISYSDGSTVANAVIQIWDDADAKQAELAARLAEELGPTTEEPRP